MPLLKVSEAAKHLSIKEKTLRAWMAERRIAYVKLGYAVRIHSEEIERFIRESTVPAIPLKNLKPKPEKENKSNR